MRNVLVAWLLIHCSAAAASAPDYAALSRNLATNEVSKRVFSPRPSGEATRRPFRCVRAHAGGGEAAAGAAAPGGRGGGGGGGG